MRFPHQPSIVAIAAVAACSVAHAQSIDQFDVRREGDNAVLQLRFANEIRERKDASRAAYEESQRLQRALAARDEQCGPGRSHDGECRGVVGCRRQSQFRNAVPLVPSGRWQPD